MMLKGLAAWMRLVAQTALPCTASSTTKVADSEVNIESNTRQNESGRLKKIDIGPNSTANFRPPKMEICK